MALELEVWQAPIVDNEGNIQPGAQVTVFNSDDTIATIYDDLNRTPRSNPFNVGSDALARFYAEPGRYRVQAQVGSDIAIYDDVDLSQKALRDDLADPESEAIFGGRPVKDVSSLGDDLAQEGSEVLISGVEAKEFARLSQLPIAGTFESGFTITEAGQFAVFKGADADGSYLFRWDGELPKEVPPSSTPDSTGGEGVGAWVDAGQAALRSDLSAQFGAGRIQNNTIALSSIKDLANIPAGFRRDDLKYSCASFWDGWSALVSSPKGGKELSWLGDLPKSEHNGITIIDPDKISDLGSTGDFGTYFEAPEGGVGCFVVSDVGVEIDFYMAGAIGDGSNDDYLALQKTADVAWSLRKTLRIPDGDFMTTLPVVVTTGNAGTPDGQTVVGNGVGSSRIIKTTNATLSGVGPRVDGINSAVIVMPVTPDSFGRYLNMDGFSLVVNYESATEEDIRVLFLDRTALQNFSNLDLNAIDRFNTNSYGFYSAEIWMTTMSRIRSRAYVGYYLNSGTSITANTLWASGCRNGYQLGVIYSTFNSCEAEFVQEGGAPFVLNACSGTTFNSPGVEASQGMGRFFFIGNSKGVTINSPLMGLNNAEGFFGEGSTGIAFDISNSSCTISAPRWPTPAANGVIHGQRFDTRNNSRVNLICDELPEWAIEDASSRDNAITIMSGDGSYTRWLQNNNVHQAIGGRPGVARNIYLNRNGNPQTWGFTGPFKAGDITLNPDPSSDSDRLGYFATADSPYGNSHPQFIPLGTVGMVRSSAQEDSTASNVSGVVSDFNALLAKLRSAGIVDS